MVTETEMLALAEGLGSAELEKRRSAAKDLLRYAREIEEVDPAYGAMEAALSDSDAEVRGDAALALLHDKWHWDDLKSLLVTIAPNDQVHPDDLGAWAEAASLRADRRASAAALLPALLERGDPRSGPFLESMKAVSRTGADISTGCPMLIDALCEGSENHAATAATALSNHLGNHPTADDVAKAMEVALTGPSSLGRFVSAQALALHHANQGALDTALDLLGNPHFEVREGVLKAFSQLPSEQLGTQRCVSKLGGCLQDSAGGVLFHAIQRLREIAAGGLSLQAAVSALEAHLSTTRYPSSGWAGGLDMIAVSDLNGESPQIDAAWCLARHYAAAGDVPAIEEISREAPDEVIRGLAWGIKAALATPDIAHSNALATLQASLRKRVGLPAVSQA